MKIYGSKDNPYDAVDAIVEYGAAAIEGSKQAAEDYSKRVIKCLEPYEDIEPIQAYQNVPNNGYLYYVFDNNRFHIGDPELKKLLLRIDSKPKGSQRGRVAKGSCLDI